MPRSIWLPSPSFHVGSFRRAPPSHCKNSSWHHGVVDLSVLPRRYQTMFHDGGQSFSGESRPDIPCNSPSGPCFPTNSAIPGLPSYTRPHSALRHQRLSALQNAGHIWPNMARVAIKILEESPINDGSWGSCSHPPTSPDRKLISLRGCGCKRILRREGVVPSLQAATVMGLSTSSVFPSRWYATVHGGMGMQSFFSLDLAWPGPSQTLARIGPGQTAPARLDCHPRLVLRGCL